MRVKGLGLSVKGDSSQAHNVESLGLRVERDSSQAQNDRTDDGGNVDGLGMSVYGDSSQAQNDKTNDNGNNKASTKSVLRWGLFGSNVYFCTLFGGIQTFPLVLVCLNGYVARTI